MKYVIILLMLGLCSCSEHNTGTIGTVDKYEDKVNNVVCYRTFYSDRLSCVYVGNNK